MVVFHTDQVTNWYSDIRHFYILWIRMAPSGISIYLFLLCRCFRCMSVLASFITIILFLLHHGGTDIISIVRFPLFVFAKLSYLKSISIMTLLLRLWRSSIQLAPMLFILWIISAIELFSMFFFCLNYFLIIFPSNSICLLFMYLLQIISFCKIIFCKEMAYRKTSGEVWYSVPVPLIFQLICLDHVLLCPVQWKDPYGIQSNGNILGYRLHCWIM